MRIYLAVTAEDYHRAAAPGRRYVHVAYRIGSDSTLLRQNLPILRPVQPVSGFRPDRASSPGRPALPLRTDLMSVSDRDAPEVQDPEALCGGVLRECARRGYGGAVLDFEGRRREDLQAFARLLDRRLRDAGRKLYLPENYAADVPDAVSLLCTAVSGGSFEDHLRETAERRGGGERLALDVQRLRMDFRLPEPSGEGEPLGEQAFRELVDGKSVYFSPDLCARYFTCTKGGEAHFVLFDDADTLRRKLSLGERYGVEAAFFQWPEVRDIVGELGV